MTINIHVMGFSHDGPVAKPAGVSHQEPPSGCYGIVEVWPAPASGGAVGMSGGGGRGGGGGGGGGGEQAVFGCRAKNWS